MKITEIKFSNYKAFYGDENSNTITINNGSNLLIYGENGSGKSSIYEGLRNLFLASNSVSDDAKFSRHLAVDEFITKGEGEDSKTVQVPAYIKLKLDDFNGNSKEIIYGTGGNVEGDSDIFEASKSCSFLSYKELLKTYLFNGESDPYKFQVNLAELIIKDILAQSINLSTTKTYIQNYNELWVAGKGTRPSRAQKEEIIREFDIGFTKDIEDINLVLNDLLYYFYPDLKIELYVIESYIDYETQNYPVFQVGLNCLHFGMDTNKNDETHLTILNESRLSALAICIFLSGIVIKTKKSTKIKFLFFDDIFIGLDTSNRIPLLKILTDFKSIVWKEDINVQTGHIVNQIQKNEDDTIKYQSTPFFDDYQIFITTYDFHWFETSKFHLPNTKWETIEMYSHSDNGLDFNLPLIISPSSNYYQKAEIYFKKNKSYKDYPASANYLRKEFEFQFKRILYDKYLLKSGEKGAVHLRDELGELRESFEKMLHELEFDYAPFKDLVLYIKTTLNPLSHDNLSKPVFKRELQDTFKIVDLLIAIEKVLILEKDMRITLTTDNSGTIRVTTLALSVDVFKFTIAGVHKYTPIILTPIQYAEGTHIKPLNYLPECGVEKAYNMIYHDVFKVKDSTVGKNILEEFVLADGTSLNLALK